MSVSRSAPSVCCFHNRSVSKEHKELEILLFFGMSVYKSMSLTVPVVLIYTCYNLCIWYVYWAGI